MTYKDWLIVGLSLVVVGFAALSVKCSRLDAQDRIFKQCNSFKMWEDGSYTCDKANGERLTGCVKGGQCND